MIKTAVSINEISLIINSEYKDPFNILGMHNVDIDGKKSIAVRAYIPNAKDVRVIEIEKNNMYFMTVLEEEGFFEVIINDREDFFKYKLIVKYNDNIEKEIYDPYSFIPIITEFDLYLFNEGKNYKIYERLGSHIVENDGIKGTLFAVWAPNAKRVSVIGNFNSWDGRVHQMRMRGTTGVWELFIPEISQGEIYKYEVKTQNDALLEKSDPYAFYAERRPCTASIVYNINNYRWQDEEWIEHRKRGDLLNIPISIYEVHLGSWRKASDDDNGFFNYRELAKQLVDYVKEMGYTHIELMPIAEHPFDGSWGYQVTGYYAPTSRYGSPDDFMYFVDYCHQNGIGVLVDWVPAHFPKDGHALGRFDGTAIYEHPDSRLGEHPEWGTYIFNFGKDEVRSFLISNAKFWIENYHIDGLRVDAVASMLYLDYGKDYGKWLPNRNGGRENLDAVEFLQQLNKEILGEFKGVMMIAEESTAWPGVSRPTYTGGLGFTFKWNMGWMNDFLRYMSKDPIHRKYHHGDLEFGIAYAFSENFLLVLSHDEVVHGKRSMLSKMPGDNSQKFANLRAAYGFMYGHPGNKLLFMGGEFGQLIEWNEKKALDWDLLENENHKGIQAYVKDLNKLFMSQPALWKNFYADGFEWIDTSDWQQSLYSFIRRGQDSRDILVFVCNFTPNLHKNYKIGVPLSGFYKEILNSDNEKYGGSNIGNGEGVFAEQIPANYRDYSIEITIPPLSVVVFKPEYDK